MSSHRFVKDKDTQSTPGASLAARVVALRHYAASPPEKITSLPLAAPAMTRPPSSAPDTHGLDIASRLAQLNERFSSAAAADANLGSDEAVEIPMTDAEVDIAKMAGAAARTIRAQEASADYEPNHRL